MKETRQDAWSKEEDHLLAETVLQYIKNGNTQLEAFKEVASKLGRTPAACGFRWNATIRKQYEEAIQYAKEERKKMSSKTLHGFITEANHDKYTIESVITMLEKMKLKMPEEEKDGIREQEKTIEQLQKENEQLTEQVERYENAWAEMQKLWEWVVSDKEQRVKN